MRYLILTAIALFMLSPAAMAADYSGHFGDMDANADGLVDRREFNGYFPHATEAKFNEADSDGSGGLNHDEWHAFKSRYGYGHGPQDGGGYKKNMGQGAAAGAGDAQGKALGRGQGADKARGVAAGTRFSAMDADRDGLLSKSEYDAALPQAGAGSFENADANADNMIDHAEWAKAAKDLGFGSGQGMGQGAGQGMGKGKGKGGKY